MYTRLMGKTEGKRTLRKGMPRQEDNIKMDIKGIWCIRVDRIHLAQNRIQWRNPMKTVMNLRLS
jgi:hypothetical protein